MGQNRADQSFRLVLVYGSEWEKPQALGVEHVAGAGGRVEADVVTLIPQRPGDRQMGMKMGLKWPDGVEEFRQTDSAKALVRPLLADRH